jgi:hypothetical protein
MATNNDGNLLDSSGNVFVDYVWGNFPAQPNDVRQVSPTQTVTAGGDQNVSWTNYGTIASARLDYTKDSHVIQESGWSGFPAFTAGTGKYNITQVSGDGTTVRYECMNYFNGGETVDITGCNGFNLTSATIATAARDYFTVTNSTAGSLININNGIVQRSDALTAADGAFVGSTAYVKVPSVLGLTTALAQDALADAELTVTTASGATNTPISVTAASRTSGSTTATLTATGAGAAFPVGTKITVASLAATGAELNGDWTVTANATNTVSFVSAGTTALALTGLAAGTVAGKSATIKTQSIAAGAASIAAAAAITITPWA